MLIRSWVSSPAATSHPDGPSKARCSPPHHSLEGLLFRTKGRRLIDRAALGPKATKALGQAFDQAWAEIAGNFGSPLEIEKARRKLAQAMLSVATEGSIDIAALKAGALQKLALDYRSQIRPMNGRPSGLGVKRRSTLSERLGERCDEWQQM
jgi:hypothetical protein